MKIRHWIPRGEVARDEVAQASCRWRRTGILPVSAGWKPALPDGHPACPTVSRFMGSPLSSVRMHWDLEPTPNPSQEGSRTAWPVPLLGRVRGGFVARRFIERFQSSIIQPDSVIFQASFLASLGRVAFQIKIQERREPFFTLEILFRHVQQRRQITDLVVLEEQIEKIGQAVERRDVRDGVVPQGKTAQAAE